MLYLLSFDIILNSGALETFIDQILLFQYLLSHHFFSFSEITVIRVLATSELKITKPPIKRIYLLIDGGLKRSEKSIFSSKPYGKFSFLYVFLHHDPIARQKHRNQWIQPSHRQQTHRLVEPIALHHSLMQQCHIPQANP